MRRPAARDAPAHESTSRSATRTSAARHRAAAQDGPDARQQFGERERLDEVVVGAELEPPDAVATSSRALRNTTGVCLRAHALDHGPAVGAGQHHVEQHQVIVGSGREMQPFDPVVRDVDDEGVLVQPLLDVGRGLGLVFDDEDAHRRRGFTVGLGQCPPASARADDACIAEL